MSLWSVPPKPYFTLLQCFLFNISYPRKIFHIDMRQFLLTPSITKVKLLFEKKRKRSWSGRMLTWIPRVGHIKVFRKSSECRWDSHYSWLYCWTVTDCHKWQGYCQNQIYSICLAGQKQSAAVKEISAVNNCIYFEVVFVEIVVPVVVVPLTYTVGQKSI